MIWAAAVVTVLVWVGTVTGNPQSTTEPPVFGNTTGCLPLITVPKDGKCVYASQEVKYKVTAQLNRRQLVFPTQVCPYCAVGVYDAFPNWSDCSKFNYCLNGLVIPLKCRDLGGVVFNPALKACEMFRSPGNVCTDRTVSLLNVLG
ncbi:hypothetical protein ACOMHN_003162 [Nucella lapillus]